MRDFNYTAIKDQKWDSEVLGYIAAIYKEVGKQEQYLKQRPAELEKLVEVARVQSTEASNAIEGIVTTNTRIRQLVEEKTTPRNRDEQEIAGYRDALNIIHENFDGKRCGFSKRYFLVLVACRHLTCTKTECRKMFLSLIAPLTTIRLNRGKRSNRLPYIFAQGQER